jgi:hypothetical protein
LKFMVTSKRGPSKGELSDSTWSVTYWLVIPYIQEDRETCCVQAGDMGEGCIIINKTLISYFNGCKLSFCKCVSVCVSVCVCVCERRMKRNICGDWI